jgi:chromate transporter
MSPAVTVQPTLAELIRYFLWLGATGFGGPIALTDFMRRDLVERRRWISEEDFVEGFALAQLSPGPLAAQLAIYIGWVRGGVLGATLVGIAFVIPSFLICVVLAILYSRFGQLGWIQGVFYTVGAAVTGIIVRSAWKLARKTVFGNRVLLVLWTVSAVFTALTETESLWVFVLAGIVALVVSKPWHGGRTLLSVGVLPIWSLSGLKGPAQEETLWQVLGFFTKAGAMVFGSGLAIVPFLHGGVVTEYGWLTERQFIDAVAVAMITPGPVVITVAFIGFLVAGYAGALLAALGTFLPCYLLTVIPAPYFRQANQHKGIKTFVEGLTAAAIGAIAGAVWVLGRRAVVDIPTAVIAALTLLILVRTKIQEPWIILGAGVLGVLLRMQG